jgi:hypothetical protein
LKITDPLRQTSAGSPSRAVGSLTLYHPFLALPASQYLLALALPPDHRTIPTGASATTGNVEIFAGATNTSGAGNFDNGASLNATVTITYTGLVIMGGSGGDVIENDAKNGVVTVGNGSDEVILGGAGAKAILGTGPDRVSVGKASLGPTRPPVAPSAIR